MVPAREVRFIIRISCTLYRTTLTLYKGSVKKGGTELNTKAQHVVPKTAAGLQGEQPLVKQDKVGKGSRLNGWVTLG